MTSAKPTVVPTHPSPRELASDLQLQLFEQAAAARLIARLLDELAQTGSNLKPVANEVLDGLVTVAHGIARTCSEAGESMSTFMSDGAR
jgi:hypothetical protein